MGSDQDLLDRAKQMLDAATRSLEAADKLNALAAESQATARKTNAEAAKLEQDNRASQTTSLRTAEATLQEKLLANAKAESDQRMLEFDKLVTNVTGAVPDLGSLQKNTVTFTTGSVLREAEVVQLSLARAARATADQVLRAVHPTADPPHADEPVTAADTSESAVVDPEATPAADATRVPDRPMSVMVTSQLGYLEAVVLNQRLSSALTALAGQATEVRHEFERVAASWNRHDEQESHTSQPGVPVFHLVAPGLPASPADALVLGAATVGAVVGQLAKLAEVDTSVQSSSSTLPATSVQAIVIRALLVAARSAGVAGRLQVFHDLLRQPPEHSEIVRRLGEVAALGPVLTRWVAAADAVGTLLVAEIAELDERLAEKDLDPVVRTNLTTRLEKVSMRSQRVAALSASAASLVSQTDELVSVITTPDAAGRTPLATALLADAVPDDCALLVVSPAAVQTNQVTVARRIFFPRVQVSATVAFDWHLLVHGRVVAADRASGSVALHAKIGRSGASWESIPALPR